MRKYKLLQNRLFIYICTLYIIGLFCGIFLFKGNKILLNSEETSFIKVFFYNYWYILLMWLFGLSAVGIIFNTIIVFFRGFLFGVLIIVLIPNDLKLLGIYCLVEIILFIPTFFTLSYISLYTSLNMFYNILGKYHSKTIQMNKYLNFFFIITLLIILYSVLITIA